MPRILTLDSRNRINADSPNNCQFMLQDTVHASKFELTNFMFANTLYNVTSYNNTLYINGQLIVTVTPKFWNADDFVQELNRQLQIFYEMDEPVVTLDSTSNILSWNLPFGFITRSPLNCILGVIGSPTGSFTTNLFLLGPLQLAFNSPELNCFSYNSIGNTAPVCGVIPVTAGNMQIQYFEPFREWTLDFQPRICFNFLQVNLTDNRNGSPAEGLGEWCCTFIVE